MGTRIKLPFLFLFLFFFEKSLNFETLITNISHGKNNAIHNCLKTVIEILVFFFMLPFKEFNCEKCVTVEGNFTFVIENGFSLTKQ